MTLVIKHNFYDHQNPQASQGVNTPYLSPARLKPMLRGQDLALGHIN